MRKAWYITHATDPRRGRYEVRRGPQGSGGYVVLPVLKVFETRILKGRAPGMTLFEAPGETEARAHAFCADLNAGGARRERRMRQIDPDATQRHTRMQKG